MRAANSAKAASAVCSVGRWLGLAVLLPFLCSCFTVTTEPRALVLQADGRIRAMTLPCPPAPPDAHSAPRSAQLDPRFLRLVTWNIHKEGDAGWQDDLAALARNTDIVLLQETTLQPAMQGILQAAGLGWVMASSFGYEDYDIGVLTAARVEALASCTQRVVEPLLRLPKSAVISWFAFAGKTQALAVVNVHAINFSLSTEEYRAQFDALADALALHQGPIILAGDFNTWSAARMKVIADIAIRLRLAEIALAQDDRTLFLGRQVDHIFTRGLRVLAARAIVVTSSDHNPVTATLQWADQ